MTNIEKQLRDFKKQGKSLKYLINYMLGIEDCDEKVDEKDQKYDEKDVLNMMVWLGYEESEIIECLEHDFEIDMSKHKGNK